MAQPAIHVPSIAPTGSCEEQTYVHSSVGKGRTQRRCFTDNDVWLVHIQYAQERDGKLNAIYTRYTRGEDVVGRSRNNTIA